MIVNGMEILQLLRGGANNKVILDKEDTAQINGYDVEGQGTAAQKDYKKKE